MTAYNYWDTKIEGNIFWLLLDRPEKKNAYNKSVGKELYQILEEVEKNPDIKVLIYGSTQDKMFCSGADIDWLMTLDESGGRQLGINIQYVYDKFEQLPIPIISAIKGLNLTAGFEMMLCTDIIIAAENSKFGQIETKYGLTPSAGGTQRLIRFVGPLKAKEIIYTAKIIDVKEAKEIGLVNHVVPLEKLDDKVREIANNICKNSGRAINLSKRLIQFAGYASNHGFQEEVHAFGDHFASGEPIELFSNLFKKK